MNWKEWLGLIGLGGLTVTGGILAVFLLVLASVLVTAGPIVLVMWVAWKLFFN